MEFLELQRQPELLRSIIDGIGEGVFVSDVRGVFTLVNPVARDFADVRENETIQNWAKRFRFFSVDGEPFVSEKLPIFRALSGESVTAAEITIERIEPFSRHILCITSRPLLSDGGEVIGAVSIFRDITEQKESDLRELSQRRKSEEVLKRQAKILDRMAEGVVVTDDKGVITYANPAFEQTFGYDPGELLGTDVALLNADLEKSRLMIREHVEKLKREGSWVGEIHNRRKDGSLFYTRANMCAVEIGGNSSFISVQEDITARKLSQQRMKKSTEEIARSNKELETFAYMASHDLKEPLRTITNYLTLLKRKYGQHLGSEGEEYMDFAVDASRRMQHLIDDLLDYSKVSMKAREVVPVDCDLVLRDVRRNLRASIEEANAELHVSHLPVVDGDEFQLGQLFQNLITNSIKYRCSETPPKISIDSFHKDHGWVFSVKDNGIGIDMAFADRIFQLFQRLHSYHEVPGTGLGLAACKRIVERHGGKIWFESKPGAGSTFYFTIPDPAARAQSLSTSV